MSRADLLLERLAIVPMRAENPSPISQDERLRLIREVLTSTGYPLVERVVALLVLLYAQPIARIVQLTMQDVVLDDDGL